MDDTLQPLDAVQIKNHKSLLIAIAVSVLLHLACALFLLGLLSGSPPPPARSVTYIDLKTTPRVAPAPMTVPPPEVADPKPLPEPLEPPAPEAPAQAQQPDAPQAQATPPQEPAKPAENLPATTLGLGLAKGYFKSIGDGQTLRAGVKGYYLEMLQVINEKWWVDQQIDKRRLSPIVINITIARNGEIIGSEIMRSSGDRRFDKAVLAALSAASPLPPLPSTYVGDSFEAPIRLVPPLNLMAW